MGFENVCNTGLVLGLRFSSAMQQNTTEKADDSMRAKVAGVSFEPNLTLGLITGTQEKVIDQTTNLINKQQCSSAADSGGSSFSNVSVKREREVGSSKEGGGDHKLVSSRVISDEDVDGDKGRKKLRLTKAQSALLEESFRKQSTLNPQKQKQELARELNLRPRQVEVWFQNRRARTKLKQTELDCEYLKKCCETLTEEKRRLQKELEELKLAQPLYMQLPASTLTMCPSCERVSTDADNTSKTSISCACGSNPHFYNPFTNSSAAC